METTTCHTTSTREYCENILADPKINPGVTTLLARSKGTILERIAKDRGVSRQAVQQQEVTAITRILKHFAADRRIPFPEIYNHFGKNAITYKEISEYLGEDVASVLCFMTTVPKYNPVMDCSYMKRYKLLVFAPNAIAAIPMLESYIERMPKRGESATLIKEVSEYATSIGVPTDIAVKAISQMYTPLDGKLWAHRDSRNFLPIEKVEYMLRVHFPDGVRIRNEKEQLPFLRELHRIFGPDDLRSGHAFDAIIQRVALTRDFATYVHPSNLKVNEGCIPVIEQYLSTRPYPVMSLYTAFDELKEKLLPYGVENAYMLQSAMRKFNSRYDSKNGTIMITKQMWLTDAIAEYLETQDDWVRIADVEREFGKIHMSQYENIEKQLKGRWYVGREFIVRETRLHTDDGTRREIQSIIDEYIKCGQLPFHTLMGIVNKKFPDFTIRTKAMTSSRFTDYIRYLFGSEYTYTQYYVKPPRAKSRKRA